MELEELPIRKKKISNNQTKRKKNNKMNIEIGSNFIYGAAQTYVGNRIGHW